MAHVFISYKSERRAAAEHLARILNLHGYTCWYDYQLVVGRDFGRQIDQQLRSAKAVVVLWCPKSVVSEWVLEEADVAKTTGKLIPVRIEEATLPLGFARLQTIDLTTWDGSPQSPTLDRLLREVARHVGRQPKAQTPELQSYETSWRALGAQTLSQFALSRGLDESTACHLSSAGEARGANWRVPRWLLAGSVVAIPLAVAIVAAFRFSDYSPENDDPPEEISRVVKPDQRRPAAASFPPSAESTALPADARSRTTNASKGARPSIDLDESSQAEAPHTTSAELPARSAEILEQPADAAPVTTTAQILAPILQFEPPVPAEVVALAPTGARVMSIARSGSTMVVDVPSGRVISRPKLVANSTLMPPTFSPDGKKFLAMFHFDNERDIHNGGSGWGVFDAASGNLIASLGDQWLCRIPVFSASGDVIHGATVYYPNSAAPPMSSCETNIWSGSDTKLVSPREEVQMFGGLIGASRSYLSFERGDKQLKRKTLENSVDRVEKTQNFDETIVDVRISPSGRHAAVTLEDKMVTVIALPDMKSLYSVYSADSYGSVETPTFTDDGQRILVKPGVTGREYELLDTATGKSVFRYPNGYYVSKAVYFDAKQGLGYTSQLKLVDGNRAVNFLPFEAHYSLWNNSPLVTDQMILMGPNASELYLVDITQQSTRRLSLPRDVGCSAFVLSKDVTRIAAACSDGVVRVWQARGS